MDLTEKHCIPCEGGTPPLQDIEEEKYLRQVGEWKLSREGTHKIRKQFQFKDFKSAIGFVNEIAEIAEQEGHHPDIYIYYNRVHLELYTHAIGGLSENDFIVAAKVDQLKP